jgi:hypothetical protein
VFGYTERKLTAQHMQLLFNPKFSAHEVDSSW